jgi:polyisoprenoid-binding protein YceI
LGGDVQSPFWRFPVFARASALALALASLAPQAHASTWVLDADHTTIGFAVRHMMVTDVKGAFDKFTGTIEIDDKDPSKSKVDVEIELASVNTRNGKRDEHLRSPDFFDVAKTPKMTFKSTKVEVAKDGGITITGDLALHGVTKSVQLKAAPLSAELKDPWGGLHRGTTATTKINRKDFKLEWNKTLEKGGVLVGDEVTIELQVELLPKK